MNRQFSFAIKNKIGKIGVPRISGLDGIDCFITDAQLTDEWQVALAEQDVKLVEVEKVKPPLRRFSPPPPSMGAD